MAKALTDIKLGKGKKDDIKSFSAGDKLSRSAFSDEQWKELLLAGAVSEDDDAEVPPQAQKATAGRAEPLSEAELKASAGPGPERHAAMQGQAPPPHQSQSPKSPQEAKEVKAAPKSASS